jgi:hypothetical protein
MVRLSSVLRLLGIGSLQSHAGQVARRLELALLAVSAILGVTLGGPEISHAYTPCTSVSISSDAKSSTLSIGTVVHFTAGATGCPTPIYQWFVGTIQNGQTNWQITQLYGPTNDYTWNTTGEQPGSYIVGVWAENQGGPGGSWDVNTGSPQFALKSTLSACITNPQVCEQAPPQTPPPSVLLLQPTKTLTSELVYAGWNSTWCGGGPFTSSFNPPADQIAVGYTHSDTTGGLCSDLSDDIARGGVGFDMGQVSAFEQAHGVKTATLQFAATGSNLVDACIPNDPASPACVYSCIGQIVSSGDPAWQSLSVGPNQVASQGGGYEISEPEGIDLLSDGGLNVPSIENPGGWQARVDVTAAVKLGYVNPALHFVFEGNDETVNNSDGHACEVTLGSLTLTLTPEH